MTRPTPKSRLAIAALLLVAIMAPAAQALAAEPGDTATAVVAERRYVPLGYWLIQRLRERLGIVPLQGRTQAAAATQAADTGDGGADAGEAGVSEGAPGGAGAATGATAGETGGPGGGGTDDEAGDAAATQTPGTEAGAEDESEAGAEDESEAGAEDESEPGAEAGTDDATEAGTEPDAEAAGAADASSETETGTGQSTAAGNGADTLRNALLYQLLGQMLADRGMGEILPAIQALEAARDPKSGGLSGQGQRELGRVLLVMSLGHVQGQLLFEAIDSTFHPDDYRS